MSARMIAAELAALFIYPVKALSGIALRESALTRRGLLHDRRFMLVDSDFCAITQREEPRLALILTRIENERLELMQAGHGTLVLPLNPDGGARHEVVIHGKRTEAIVIVEASGWFSQVLGRPVRLVYQPDDAVRRPNPSGTRPDDEVSFADAYPLLLASESSLVALNERLPEPIEMRRFRPNAVIRGAPAFAEDCWARLCIGRASFRAPKLCDRCIVTTVDPDTGARGKEPLRTLARFRERDGAVWFATNLVPDGPGTLRVGDGIEVLEWREPFLTAS